MAIRLGNNLSDYAKIKCSDPIGSKKENEVLRKTFKLE